MALWKRAFDAGERAIGPRLEQGVQTPAFATAVGVVGGLRRRVDKELERRSRQLLHLANMPAATDVRRLRRQVADLDREIRLLRDLLERQSRTTEREEPTSGDRNGNGGRAAASAGGRARAAAPRRGAQRAARPQRDQDGDGDGPAS